MDTRIRQFRSAVRKLGGPGRGWRYPLELRDLAVSYWLDGKDAGLSLRAASADLKVTEVTLQRWADASSAEEAGGLQEVVLAGGDSASFLAVVTPGGYRIEGLNLSEVTTLLRSLR